MGKILASTTVENTIQDERQVTATAIGDKHLLDVNGMESAANTQLITIPTQIAAYLGGEYIETTEYTNFFKTDNGTAWLDNCYILNKDFVSHQLHAFVYSEEPTITSAINTAYSISDSEREKEIGAFVVQIGAEFPSLLNFGMFKPNINMKVFNTSTVADEKRSLWIVWVTGTGVTYTSVDGLSYRIN
jgi:hypothetical protein